MKFWVLSSLCFNSTLTLDKTKQTTKWSSGATRYLGAGVGQITWWVLFSRYRRYRIRTGGNLKILVDADSDCRKCCLSDSQIFRYKYTNSRYFTIQKITTIPFEWIGNRRTKVKYSDPTWKQWRNWRFFFLWGGGKPNFPTNFITCLRLIILGINYCPQPLRCYM